MYKTLHGQAAIKHKTVMKTRNSDPTKFIPVKTACDKYKYSFWPRTINFNNSFEGLSFQGYNHVKVICRAYANTRGFKAVWIVHSGT